MEDPVVQSNPNLIEPYDSETLSQNPVYFLVRYDIGYFTCYARGLSILNIQNLSEFRIMRFCGTRITNSGTRLIQGSLIPEFYPLPSKDLTHHIITLQRQWHKKRQYRKWCGHPLRLRYRELNGTFPPNPISAK
jgi:hypothetical protein